MKDNFQLIIIVFFIATAIFGILVFSGAIPLGSDGEDAGQGTVVVWGTMPFAAVSPALEDFNGARDTYRVDYVEKNPATFDEELLEALASGTGPDLFFLPDELAFHYANKIFTIPYESYPSASFKQNFADAGEVFMTSSGIIAFPMTVDPMMMYYSRSMLDADNIVTVPSDWDEFATAITALTKLDESGKILKSGAALGHFANVTHAKEILAALFMQMGDPIVREEEGIFTSTLNRNNNLEPSLMFYTAFADPTHELYSWNRSFPPSREYFGTENLAFYFGYASELLDIADRNPNQNFYVAQFPQVRGANFKLTNAHVTGIAISAFSRNFNTAFIAAGELAAGNFSKMLADNLGIAPARRDLLTQIPSDPFSPVFYASALYAKAFLDPSPEDTESIFRTLVETVLSNQETPRDALRDAQAKIGLLLIR